MCPPPLPSLHVTAGYCAWHVPCLTGPLFVVKGTLLPDDLDKGHEDSKFQQLAKKYAGLTHKPYPRLADK